MTHTDETTSQSLIENAHEAGAPLTSAISELCRHFGYIDAAAIPELALTYARSEAEVLGVISYYSDFRRTRPGKHILRICQAEACQAAGARELTRYATKKLGIGLNETTPDNQITLEAVYCLGLCASGPALEIDKRAAAMVDEQRLDDLLGEIVK